jgi:hypothetical protein
MQTRIAIAAALGIMMISTAFAADELQPGVARWNLKVGVLSSALNKKAKPLTVDELKQLPAPPFDPKDFKTKRMRSTGSTDPQEGDVVRVKNAWVQLVALEKATNGRDGDYHIQINTDRTDRDKCVIVEVPYEKFAPNDVLGKKYGNVRSLIRDKFFAGNEPKGCLKHPVEVTLTGQLFYDATHKPSASNPGGGRGKGGCSKNAATVWEVHPVLTMKITSQKGLSEVPCK